MSPRACVWRIVISPMKVQCYFLIAWLWRPQFSSWMSLISQAFAPNSILARDSVVRQGRTSPHCSFCQFRRFIRCCNMPSCRRPRACRRQSHSNFTKRARAEPYRRHNHLREKCKEEEFYEEYDPDYEPGSRIRTHYKCRCSIIGRAARCADRQDGVP
jgi:hypothetical protein